MRSPTASAISASGISLSACRASHTRRCSCKEGRKGFVSTGYLASLSVLARLFSSKRGSIKRRNCAVVRLKRVSKGTAKTIVRASAISLGSARRTCLIGGSANISLCVRHQVQKSVLCISPKSPYSLANSPIPPAAQVSL
jgi:hypothetical protein